MNKYKVEFVQKDTFVIDVLAKNESEAKKQASKLWNKIAKKGMYHYYQNKDTEVEIDTVYDVTNTDDVFNPVNEA